MLDGAAQGPVGGRGRAADIRCPTASGSVKSQLRQQFSVLNLATSSLSGLHAGGGFGRSVMSQTGCNKVAKTRLTAWGLTHIWRLTAADAASFEGSAFVSCLFLVGTTDARNQSNRERKRVGSLTLLV